MGRPAVSEDVFRVIADPTRRALLDLLRARGEESVGALGRPFRLSAASLSRHLKVLREAGLVEERRDGRRRLYRLRADTLREVASWVAPYEPLWAARPRVRKR